jgi:hypothetical protein
VRDRVILRLFAPDRLVWTRARTIAATGAPVAVTGAHARWHPPLVVERFDPEVVKRELRVIRDDLHCNTVGVTGGDPERLELAAGFAADLGLEVWFSPYPLVWRSSSTTRTPARFA